MSSKTVALCESSEHWFLTVMACFNLLNLRKCIMNVCNLNKGSVSFCKVH